MKIPRHHRHPLPGSGGTGLGRNPHDSYVIEVESDGLFDALLMRLGNLAPYVVQLAESVTEQGFEQA